MIIHKDISKPGIAGLLKLCFILGAVKSIHSQSLQPNRNVPERWKADIYHQVWRRNAENACPSGYTPQSSGSCYKLYTSTKTWNAAKSACNREGALLVESENWDSLKKFTFGKLNSYGVWLGARNNGTSNSNFKWVTSGSTVDMSSIQSNYVIREPPSCLYISPIVPFLGAFECNSPESVLPFICEVPAIIPLTKTATASASTSTTITPAITPVITPAITPAITQATAIQLTPEAISIDDVLSTNISSSTKSTSLASSSTIRTTPATTAITTSLENNNTTTAKTKLSTNVIPSTESSSLASPSTKRTPTTTAFLTTLRTKSSTAEINTTISDNSATDPSSSNSFTSEARIDNSVLNLLEVLEEHLSEKIKGAELVPEDIRISVSQISSSTDRHKEELASTLDPDEKLEMSHNYTCVLNRITDDLLTNPMVWHGVSNRLDDATKVQVQLSQGARETAELINIGEVLFCNSKTTRVQMGRQLASFYHEEINRTYYHHDMKNFPFSKIVLPQALLPDKEEISITFTSFTNMNCIISSSVNCREVNGSFSVANGLVVSPVMGITIGSESWRATDEDSFVHVVFDLHFPPNMPAYPPFRCVSWNTEFMFWDETGGQLLNVTQLNKTHGLARCSYIHLTNLAVIMDVRGNLVRNTVLYDSLTWITKIGCSLSIICLAASFMYYLVVKKMRSKITSKIRANICLCLLLAQILILTGLNQIHARVLCTIIAAALHYTLLAAFTWTVVESFNMYLCFVKVMPSGIEWKRYMLFGYSIPLLIVLGTYASVYLKDPDTYLGENWCWLDSKSGVIWAMAGPLLIVIMINMIIFTITMRKAWDKTYQFVGQRHIGKVESNFPKFVQSVGLFFVLGLTWITGYLYLDEGTVFMSVLFTVMNSLQGVVIFCILIIPHMKGQIV